MAEITRIATCTGCQEIIWLPGHKRFGDLIFIYFYHYFCWASHLEHSDLLKSKALAALDVAELVPLADPKCIVDSGCDVPCQKAKLKVFQELAKIVGKLQTVRNRSKQLEFGGLKTMMYFLHLFAPYTKLGWFARG